MRRFFLSGTFDAESVDDAFRLLAEHFALLAVGRDEPSPLGNTYRLDMSVIEDDTTKEQ